jgi:hypothetical protein
MTVERVRKTTSRSGALNVEVDGLPYHSAYDPRRESLKFCNAYAIEKADVIVQFGWGLGYCGEVLKNRMKSSARVIVFEPDAELFHVARACGENISYLHDPRFRFIVGSEACQFFDYTVLDGCRETDEFLWILWPSALHEHSEIASKLQQSFKMRLRDRAANLLTHIQNGALYFKNVVSNFSYQADPDAGLLFDRFENIPLIIVAAGPSLDRNIHELRDLHNRCFVLAVDTALRPLLAAGVTPHAVLIADPTELNARHVLGVVPESVYLIAEQAVDAGALSSARHRFLFGVGLFPDSLCNKYGFGKRSLQLWGSVATGALDLALKMGANPIVFTGQDFAYSWGRNYVRNTIFHDYEFDADLNGTHHEVDVWGNKIPTTENLIAYRDFFVRKIRQTSGVRFINATEGGILTEAVEIMSLRDALTQCCASRLDIAAILERAYKSRPRVSDVNEAIHHLHGVLERRDFSCGCLGGFLELTAKEALLKKNEVDVSERILWGSRICEEFCRSHAAGLHSSY